jgi:hypothetical protein
MLASAMRRIEIKALMRGLVAELRNKPHGTVIMTRGNKNDLQLTMEDILHIDNRTPDDIFVTGVPKTPDGKVYMVIAGNNPVTVFWSAKAACESAIVDGCDPQTVRSYIELFTASLLDAGVLTDCQQTTH